MLKRLFLTFSVLIFGAANAFALNVSNVHEALLVEDYHKVKVLAEELLKDTNRSNEEKQSIKYYLGVSHFQQENFREAEKIFSELSKSSNNALTRDRAMIGLFDVLYVREDYTQAMRLIKKMLKRANKSDIASLIYLKAARANLKLSRWEKAQSFLLKIVEEYPESLEFHTAAQLLDEEKYYTVQVGAFLERDRAEHLMEDLLDQDHYAYIVRTTDKDGQTFYRVRVGQIAKLNNAQSLKTKLAGLGYPTRIFP